MIEVGHCKNNFHYMYILLVAMFGRNITAPAIVSQEPWTTLCTNFTPKNTCIFAWLAKLKESCVRPRDYIARIYYSISNIYLMESGYSTTGRTQLHTEGALLGC